jgi:primosomal protein N' (replication factor Y)
LLLSSATPSVTTYSSALSGRYTLNVLKNRYGPAILPEVITVDMRQELHQGNTSAISKTLVQYLEAALAEKRQSILLINRRGYNTFAVCRACSEVITCHPAVFP